MSDVAALAGVSLKTVSRVVGGEGGVQQVTADRVRAAVSELGFRRNDAASSLARAAAPSVIGVVIEDLADPFYSRLAGAIEQIARRRGFLVVLGSSQEDAGLERAATLALADRGVAGLIVVPHSDDHRYLEPEVRGGLRLVFVDRPPSRLRADAVLGDNVDGARRGVAHLIEGGARRIAFVGNEHAVYTSAQRLRGYRRAHDEAGITIDPGLIVQAPHTPAESEREVLRLLEEAAPDAVFSQNNLLTMGAWRAIRRAERRIPLVGYDDFAMADVLDPPVTVVAQDPAELGRAAAELLFARLDGLVSAPRRTVVPARLIVRD